MRPPSPRSLRGALALSVLLAALSAARAEDRGLKPSYDFVVDINGVTDKGWKMMSPPQNKTRILLVSPLADQALLVSIADKSVRPVDRLMIKNNPDGTADILAGGVSSTRIIPLIANGSGATFVSDGRSFMLKPRPPLLGPHSVEDLVTDRPNFGEGIKSYQPESSAVSYLKSYEKPTEIEVFFGSWCPVCENWVPKLLKSLQQAGNSKIQVNLIGVSRDFSTDQNLAKAKGVRGLPTFIVRQNGIEVGRLVGAPESGTLEAALAGMLRNRS
jgi:thiol-disulfide isomerase/thioredoxin